MFPLDSFDGFVSNAFADIELGDSFPQDSSDLLASIFPDAGVDYFGEGYVNNITVSKSIVRLNAIIESGVNGIDKIEAIATEIFDGVCSLSSDIHMMKRAYNNNLHSMNENSRQYYDKNKDVLLCLLLAKASQKLHATNTKIRSGYDCEDYSRKVVDRIEVILNAFFPSLLSRNWKMQLEEAMASDSSVESETTLLEEANHCRKRSHSDFYERRCYQRLAGAIEE